MRPEDRKVFVQAARQLKLWILVRRTKAISDQYIGEPKFCPKPIDCKAKTADLGPFAGLVVSMDLKSDYFSIRRSGDAAACWSKFDAMMKEHPEKGYAVVEDRTSSFYGCVTLQGAYLYSDYDLYDIVDPKCLQRNLALLGTLQGEDHARGSRFYQVEQYINNAIRVPMIRHGGQAQCVFELSEEAKKNPGQHTNEPIDVFGPDGEEFTTLNRDALDDLYRERFKGRRLLTQPHW